MNRLNFKHSVIALAIGMFAVSCGGSGSKKPQQSETKTGQAAPAKSGSAAEIKDVATGNWQKTVRDYFGIDVSVPGGWTVNEAKSLNNRSDVRIEFTAGGTTEWATFGETVFEKTKAVSTDGIKAGTNDNVYTSFNDAKQGSKLATWKYFYPSTNAAYGGTSAPVRVMYEIEYDGSIVLTIDGVTK
jgi:hypothetical protein